MSLGSSFAYNFAASQVLHKMEELADKPDRWESLKEWVDKVLRHDE